MDSREAEFARRLASNDKKTRDRSVKKLKTWLHHRSSLPTGFTENDMLKLWKGLFYCMWMSDKPLVQEELADNISKLVHSLRRTDLAFQFIDAFFVTMQREWEGLDRLRLDKFYMLIRCCTRECFRLLKTNEWSENAVRDFASVIQRGPLRSTGSAHPDGIRTLLVEKFIPELIPLADDKLSPDSLNLLLQPLCVYAGRADNFGDVMSFVHTILEPLIEAPSVHQLVEDDSTQSLKVDHSKIGALLFSVASDQETKGKNRRKLFQLKQRFVARNDEVIRGAASELCVGRTDGNDVEMMDESVSGVEVNGDMEGMEMKQRDCSDCETTLEDEGVEESEVKRDDRKEGKKKTKKKESKGTSVWVERDPDGDSLREDSQNSSIHSNSSTDSVVTFNFHHHLHSTPSSSSSAFTSTPKAKLTFNDTRNLTETSTDCVSGDQPSDWFVERVKKAKRRWRKRRKVGMWERRVYVVDTATNSLEHSSKENETVEELHEVTSPGDVLEECELPADGQGGNKEKKKKRVSFDPNEVQVQEFIKNVFVSSGGGHDASKAPQKGVLKASPSPAAGQSLHSTVQLSTHPMSTRSSVISNVKGKRMKASDFF